MSYEARAADASRGAVKFITILDHTLMYLLNTHQKAYRAGEDLVEQSGCRRCSSQTRDLGAAAIELLRVVDIGRDRGMYVSQLNILHFRTPLVGEPWGHFGSVRAFA